MGRAVTGVCQRTLCACRIGCRVSTAGTDRSSSERWLERSSHPDLGSGCITRANRLLPSGLLAENARPASPAAASAVSIASSRPGPLGGLRPALTSRPPPACLMPTACADQGTMNSHPLRCRHKKRLDKRVPIEGTFPFQASRMFRDLRQTASKCHDGEVKIFINSLGMGNHDYSLLP